ncbi:MAG: Methyltransferase type 12 [Patescibacteria group bacterium]|nr:Methyltransferase type 12 [Patescibacteria group bacterium]
MTDYDIFAPFYDTVMGDRQDVIAIIQDLAARHHPSAQTMLELGCGTGGILAGFQDQYTLTGIDQSAQMLQIAHQKLPEGTFHRGTIAGFELHQTFDIIICVFDTINHLTSFADWQKLFADAQKHLSTNGLFIFDMNTIGRLRALTTAPGYTQDIPNGVMDMTITPISTNEVEWHIVIQESQSDGLIQVYEEQVREASFPLSQVERELASQSFSLLQAFDSDHASPSDSSDRVYYACHRL